MKLEDLLKEFSVDRTTIQDKEHANKFIGLEILILGYINNINDDKISLCQFSHYCRCNSIPSWEHVNDWDYWIDHKNNRHYVGLHFNKDIFGRELVKFSLGDEVKILATLDKAYFPGKVFSFDLVSIEKTSFQ